MYLQKVIQTPRRLSLIKMKGRMISMLDAKKITLQSDDLEQLQQLYLTAFPDNERSPLELLLTDSSDCSEIYAFYDCDIFCGFVSLLTYGDITHIIYFAVNDKLRGQGFGSGILQCLEALKSKARIVADIEAQIPDAPNLELRKNRKKFYLKNGFIPSGVTYDWRGDSYEILVKGGELTEKEFWDFWQSVTDLNNNFSEF